MTAMRFFTADERTAELRGAKIAIFGRPGAGKTSLLRTLSSTALATTLFVVCEGGDLSVLDLPVASVRPQTMGDLRDIAAIVGGPDPARPASAPYSAAHFESVAANPAFAVFATYRTIFIDSLTQVMRLFRIGAEQQPEALNDRGRKDLRKIYGLIGNEGVGFVQQFQRDRGRNIVFVAVLEKVVDDFGVATWRPQLEGAKTARELPAIVDEIITLEQIDFGDGKPVRALVCTEPNLWKLPAKDRSGKLDQIEKPDLGALLTKLTSPSSAQGEKP